MIFDTLEDEVEFGKFQGMSWGEVLLIHPDYLAWVVENVRNGYMYITDNAMEEIRLMFPSFEMNKRFYDSVEAQRCAYDNDMEECKCQQSRSYDEMYDEQATYERYGGTYAQDVMGYSDDDIDTIFDGDPLAYWNID